MKYKEFEKKLGDLDLFVECNTVKQITIYTARQVSLAIIDDDDQYDLYFSGKCRLLSPETREKFFSLALEYASTPVEARVGEKKYNVIAYRQKYGKPNDISELTYFYWRGNDFGRLYVSSDEGNADENQQWTMSQIREYDLEDCERIEIKGEE